MVTEQELKEKLLKFAGWKKSFNDYQNGDWWRTPNGEITCKLPDFAHDIGTCLAYLGPKFDTWDLAKVQPSNLPEVYSYFYRVNLRTSEGRDFTATSEISLALAFCHAAEQAIDKMAE